MYTNIYKATHFEWLYYLYEDTNMLNRIQKTINIIDDYIDTMYKDYGDGIKKLPEIVKEIQEISVEFLNKIGYYNQHGENIQTDVILLQLENLLNAIDLKDPIQIVDTLEYEIKESFVVYKELVYKYGE